MSDFEELKAAQDARLQVFIEEFTRKQQAILNAAGESDLIECVTYVRFENESPENLMICAAYETTRRSGNESDRGRLLAIAASNPNVRNAILKLQEQLVTSGAIIEFQHANEMAFSATKPIIQKLEKAGVWMQYRRLLDGEPTVEFDPEKRRFVPRVTEAKLTAN